METLKCIFNGLIFLINSSAVAVICFMLSRWLKRIEDRTEVMYESIDDLHEAITRCNFNAIGIHIENMRLQLHILSQKEEYEAMGQVKEELSKSLEIYNRLNEQLKELQNGKGRI